MKKLFLVLVFAFAGIFTANAQVWIGGGLGGKFQKEYTQLSISPEIGYAFNNHWQVALGAGYSFEKSLITTHELYLEP